MFHRYTAYCISFSSLSSERYLSVQEGVLESSHTTSILRTRVLPRIPYARWRSERQLPTHVKVYCTIPTEQQPPSSSPVIYYARWFLSSSMPPSCSDHPVNAILVHYYWTGPRCSPTVAGMSRWNVLLIWTVTYLLKNEAGLVLRQQLSFID